MKGQLAARIGAAFERAVDPAVSQFAIQLAEETGAVAVLFYGSNLRTGSRAGVLDFYVLLPGPPERGIWPRVSYREWQRDGETLRAKIASMTLAKFCEACAGRSRDTTIWARFVQPCVAVWIRGAQTRITLARALEEAAKTAARLAALKGPEKGLERDFWLALFQATYAAELRVEKPGRAEALVAMNAAHFDGLLPAALDAQGVAYAQDGAQFCVLWDKAERKHVSRWWNTRQRIGKLLNIARLIRATATFDGAARYAAWKIERHTGAVVPISPFQERHPILGAPRLALAFWQAKRK